jgi:hypothetical protein
VALNTINLKLSEEGTFLPTISLDFLPNGNAILTEDAIYFTYQQYHLKIR